MKHKCSLNKCHVKGKNTTEIGFTAGLCVKIQTKLTVFWAKCSYSQNMSTTQRTKPLEVETRLWAIQYFSVQNVRRLTSQRTSSGLNLILKPIKSSRLCFFLTAADKANNTGRDHNSTCTAPQFQQLLKSFVFPVYCQCYEKAHK